MLNTILYIYKHVPYIKEGYDPTNGGLSSRLDTITVFPEDATDENIKAWCDKHGKHIEDAARIVKNESWGQKHLHIEPVIKPKGMIGPIFGGNFAYTSNGIWANMTGEKTCKPVPIHDRFETEEQYNALSR